MYSVNIEKSTAISSPPLCAEKIALSDRVTVSMCRSRSKVLAGMVSTHAHTRARHVIPAQRLEGHGGRAGTGPHNIAEDGEGIEGGGITRCAQARVAEGTNKKRCVVV
jgi:hypothetical protein